MAEMRQRAEQANLGFIFEEGDWRSRAGLGQQVNSELVAALRDKARQLSLTRAQEHAKETAAPGLEAADSEPAGDAPDSGLVTHGTVGFSIYQVPGSDGLWAPAYTSGDVTVQAPQYRVGKVTEGSDAERQGVEPDAMLVAINGTPAGGLPLHKIKSLLIAPAASSANLLLLLAPGAAAPGGLVSMDVAYDCAVAADDQVRRRHLLLALPPVETLFPCVSGPCACAVWG
jgi:hypothetical protein